MKNNQPMSREHLLYLRGLKKNNLLVNLARIAILLTFLLLWETSAYFEWINPFITSSPSRIVKTIIELYQSGSLFHHVGTTLWETLTGFAIAVVLGYSIALLLWWSNAVRRISEPYFVVLNALPKIATIGKANVKIIDKESSSLYSSFKMAGTQVVKPSLIKLVATP